MNNLSILICDDSDEIRNEMSRIFRKLGVTSIYEAADGEEAIEVCEKYTPNLVFLDIIMPRKDGIAALKEIHGRFPHIKVVISSSSTGQSHLKNTKLLGAYAFIQKPIDEKQLSEILTKYLNENKKSI